MGNIVHFETLKDFIIFLGRKGCIQQQLIGEGFEGKCYLSSVDGGVYKIITNRDVNGNLMFCYDSSKVITSQDIKLNHYVLPDELYVVGDELVGYKTRYIKEKSIFDESTTNEVIKKLYGLKENVLINAYYKILKETDLLSKESIKIYDLTYNLLFTGTGYYGIDTCGYERINENVLLSNRERLNTAIKENFYELLSRTNFCLEDAISELDEVNDMEEYSRGLIRLIRK